MRFPTLNILGTIAFALATTVAMNTCSAATEILPAKTVIWCPESSTANDSPEKSGSLNTDVGTEGEETRRKATKGQRIRTAQG